MAGRKRFFSTPNLDDPVPPLPLALRAWRGDALGWGVAASGGSGGADSLVGDAEGVAGVAPDDAPDPPPKASKAEGVTALPRQLALWVIGRDARLARARG